MSQMDAQMKERMQVFMESMMPRQTDLLNTLEQEALGEAVPIIRPQTRSLLQFLVTLTKPRRILEIGTGTGFSACCLMTWAPADAQITTIERDPERIRRARDNFARIPAPERIMLLEGDAAQILPELGKANGDNGPSAAYDFIFMDAAKGQYIALWPEVRRLLAPGGLLVSDNILQDGMILESRFAVPRRDRTIHKRMREYLTALTQDPLLQTLLLQEGDGMAVTLRKA